MCKTENRRAKNVIKRYLWIAIIIIAIVAFTGRILYLIFNQEKTDVLVLSVNQEVIPAKSMNDINDIIGISV